MKKIAVSIAALAAAGMALAGCAQPAPKEPAPEAPPQIEQPAATAFTSKSADGRLEAKVVVAGKVAMVDLVASNFDLNAKFASAAPKDPVNKENEGHFIVRLDDKDPLYLGSLRTSLRDLEAGKHTLKVQMVNNDNTPVGVETSVEFEVK